MCNLYSSKDLLSSENNSTYSHYCQKSWQQNWVHPKSVVSNPAPEELLSYRFQLQTQSSTPEPANQGL